MEQSEKTNPDRSPKGLDSLVAKLFELGRAIEYIFASGAESILLGEYLGRFMLGIFAIGLLIGIDNFLTALARKYPAQFCGYCEKNPCVCQRERKRESVRQKSRDGSEQQLEWGIHRWWEHLSSLYRARNTESGGETYVLKRLLEEIQELKNALESFSGSVNAAESGQEAADDLADVFAWTIGLSDLADIVLEQEVAELSTFPEMDIDACTLLDK